MLMDKMKDSTREFDFIFRDDAHSRCDRVMTVPSFKRTTSARPHNLREDQEARSLAVRKRN